MALDEPTDEDGTFDVDGFTFCINKELLAQIEGVTLDFGYMGFAINPTKPLPSSGGSSCGGCAGSSGCGS